MPLPGPTAGRQGVQRAVGKRSAPIASDLRAMPAVTPTATTSQASTVPATPTVRRRLTCMLYECVLLFGVLMASTAVYVFARPLLQRLGIDDPLTIQLWSFLVLGAYFTWFWQRSGQTLAMQTWRIRLETLDGKRPSWSQAALRFVLAWLWLPPAAAVGHGLGLVKGPFVGALAVGLLIWVMLAWLDPRRQFLHDRLARTRLVDLRTPNS